MKFYRLGNVSPALALIISLLPLPVCSLKPHIPGGGFNTPSGDLRPLWTSNLLPSVLEMKLIDIIAWKMAQEQESSPPTDQQDHMDKPSQESLHKASSGSRKHHAHHNDLSVKEDGLVISDRKSAHGHQSKHHKKPFKKESRIKKYGACPFSDDLRNEVEQLNTHLDFDFMFIYKTEDGIFPQTEKAAMCGRDETTNGHASDQCYSVVDQKDLGSDYFPRILRNTRCIKGFSSRCQTKTQTATIFKKVGCDNQRPKLMTVRRLVHTGCSCNTGD